MAAEVEGQVSPKKIEEDEDGEEMEGVVSIGKTEDAAKSSKSTSLKISPKLKDTAAKGPVPTEAKQPLDFDMGGIEPEAAAKPEEADEPKPKATKKDPKKGSSEVKGTKKAPKKKDEVQAPAPTRRGLRVKKDINYKE